MYCLVVRACLPAFGIAWKYALKIAPSLCLLKENVTSITFPEDVSFITGDEPETGSPHHLKQAHASGSVRKPQIKYMFLGTN